jgi:hypothetical protein
MLRAGMLINTYCGFNGWGDTLAIIINIKVLIAARQDGNYIRMGGIVDFHFQLPL